MSVAYEHIRIAHKFEVIKQLMLESFKEIVEIPTDASSAQQNIKRTELKDDIPLKSLVGLDENVGELQELNPVGSHHRQTVTSFLACSSPPIGNAQLDVGKNFAGRVDTITKLVCVEKAELDRLYAIIGRKPHTQKALEGRPSWLREKAIKEEIKNSWTESMKLFQILLSERSQTFLGLT